MIIGGAAGFGVWMLIYNFVDPKLVYFGKEDNMKETMKNRRINYEEIKMKKRRGKEEKR